MADSIRIRTSPNGGDKYVKVNLDQKFDFIEILSLKISQEEAYTKFCSDYGVIVGRVIVNNGFGVPNAKVSVFIPLDDIDKNNPEIKGLYPYEIVTDKNDEGVRYNLLPKDLVTNNECFTSIGSFPSKREVLDNEPISEIYCKYYKFTSTTNYAGDFMIFGVPLGTYVLHMDVDISDIGIISQRPYDLISQGTPEKIFETTTKFKGGKNLDTLVQLKSMNAGINVQPFWGDIDNCDVGINRVDFNLNTTIVPSAIFIGSIFGDQDKYSVNKNCRPRKGLGKICEQITGEGTINMIRKTIDGGIEYYDVNGGRVIDENGSWAYQIPMNLDYVITDENGDLIPSNDVNVGLPTRASVRFKIGLDETGDIGKMRTRAKYLIPNNPKNMTEVDYNFGPIDDENLVATKDSSFRDLSWNKIYTISNFIPRYEGVAGKLGALPSPLAVLAKNEFTGIKDVDSCAGVATPFPYNKININNNPMFLTICMIGLMISILMYNINLALIYPLNLIIWALNQLVAGLCSFFIGLDNLLDTIGLGPGVPSFCDGPAFGYIACMRVTCGEQDLTYAPGCLAGTLGQEVSPSPDHFTGDGHGHIDISVGLSDCLAISLAEALDVYQFNFYNDWVNGSLYSYLLKYKKKDKKHESSSKEKFCEYECNGGNFIPIDGTDSGGNGNPDNNCNNFTYLADTCFDSSGLTPFTSHKKFETVNIKEGLIKKVGEELIYAATTHFDTGNSHKLFATELLCLGSVFDNDWENKPKIAQYLIPTTYKLPPDTYEVNEDGNLDVCGMYGSRMDNADGLFFKINCTGLHVDNKGCLSLRHICEFGIDLDEGTTDAYGTYSEADCVIGSKDVNYDTGKFVRNVIYGLNNGLQWNGIDNTWNTDFNLSNAQDYNYITQNGAAYNSFRGYTNQNPNSLVNTEHSYFFYFGLIPGKSAIEKMNSNFFVKCK